MREADEAAEALIAAGQAADASEAEEEGMPGLPAAGHELSSGIFKSNVEFQMLVQTGRLLLEQGRLSDAKQLMQSCIRLFSRSVHGFLPACDCKACKLCQHQAMCCLQKFAEATFR